MENSSRSNNKASQLHSSAPSKQKRSGYEPSDTEAEWHESPWDDHNNQNNGTSDLGEADKIKSNLPRNISPLKLSRRQPSKVEYDKESPPRKSPLPRRHANKSPYKPRRDDGRNISPLPKSEHRRHVSPYKPGRVEHALNDEKGDGEITGLNRKQSRGTPTGDEIKTIGQLVGAGRVSENSKYSHRSTTGDIFFSRDAAALAKQKKGLPNNGGFGKPIIPKPPLLSQKDTPPHQRTIANRNVNPKDRGLSSGTGLSRTTMTPSIGTSRQSNGKLSVENSKISDSSGSSLNSMKFVANIRKSQSETWFGCVMRRGSCRTSKKSPEREKAFDEASFIGKAFVVEKLRQFWADQYQPTSLNGFTLRSALNLIVSSLQVTTVDFTDHGGTNSDCKERRL